VVPTRVPLAVIDRDALFRRPLCVGLREVGFAAVERSDLLEWARCGGERIAVVASHADVSVEVLTEACAVNSELILIMIADDTHVGLVIDALRGGATAVVNPVATFDELTQVLSAALDRKTLMPSHVIRAISRRAQPTLECRVSEREVDWIRALASGHTVTSIAAQAGYSEREMYRLLHRAYLRLGAHNRSEALVRATAYGLIREVPDSGSGDLEGAVPAERRA
jgi:DNA-binding NarL/FixJ family response regulator